MSSFLCCLRAPFKLAPLNWIPLDKYCLKKHTHKRWKDCRRLMSYLRKATVGRQNPSTFKTKWSHDNNTTFAHHTTVVLSTGGGRINGVSSSYETINFGGQKENAEMTCPFSSCGLSTISSTLFLLNLLSFTSKIKRPQNDHFFRSFKLGWLSKA